MRTRRSWGDLRRSENVLAIFLVVAVGGLALRPQIANLIPVAPPSTEVEQLAQETTMTSEAQQIFYRQTPSIEQKPAFFEGCQKPGKIGEKLIAFGCYVSNGRSGKIMLQSVSDVRFQGIMEVSAAHEMLHAAYERLSQSDRDALAPRLKKAARLVKDRRLASVLEQYRKTDDQLFVNELHSHLGTELSNLEDPELEQHYQRYFRDRHQVVAFARQSQAALRQIDEKSDQLKAEIVNLEADLKQTKQSIKADEQALESSQQNLDTQHADLTNFKTQAEQAYRQGTGTPNLVTQFEQLRSSYNEAVRAHNDRVQQHQTQVDEFKAQIDQYKQRVNAYNALAHQEHDLLAEVDAKPAIPSKTVLGNSVPSLSDLTLPKNP
jgi:phage shock protein A